METPRPSHPADPSGYKQESRYKDDDERSDDRPSRYPRERETTAVPTCSERDDFVRHDTRDRREGRDARPYRHVKDERFDERTFSPGYGGSRQVDEREGERDRVLPLPPSSHHPSEHCRSAYPVPAPSGPRYDDTPSRSDLFASRYQDGAHKARERHVQPDDKGHVSSLPSAGDLGPIAGRRPPEVGSMSTSLQQQLRLTSFYVRPGFGKAGKPIDVLSNFFQVRSKAGRAKLIQ